MSRITTPIDPLDVPAWAKASEQEEAQTWVIGAPLTEGVQGLTWGAEGAEVVVPEEEVEPEPEEKECSFCEQTRQEAAQETERHVAEVVGQHQESVAAFDAGIKNINERVNREVLRLSTMIAERILNTAITLDPELAIAHLKRAFEAAGPLTKVTVRTHPDLVEKMRTEAPALAEGVSGQPVDVVVQADETIALGGASLVYEAGQVDATFETAVERLNEVLTEVLAVPAASREADETEGDA